MIGAAPNGPGGHAPRHSRHIDVDRATPVGGAGCAWHSHAVTPEELLASNAALSGEVLRSQEALKIALLTIDKLKVELAYLRRMKYGRSSEQLEHAQLELVGGQASPPVPFETAPAIDTENAADGAQGTANISSLQDARDKRKARQQAAARGLPDHLPRRTVIHMPSEAGGCKCETCGSGLREIGRNSPT